MLGIIMWTRSHCISVRACVRARDYWKMSLLTFMLGHGQNRTLLLYNVEYCADIISQEPVSKSWLLLSISFCSTLSFTVAVIPLPSPAGVFGIIGSDELCAFVFCWWWSWLSTNSTLVYLGFSTSLTNVTKSVNQKQNKKRKCKNWNEKIEKT